ncbi:MAG: PQQ-binding-like beta-propeller repeat protein [Pirellulales bacterium]|nr:PQQ-binding-like beta-propeller repeat protein [Pirellulales bacterium]
MRPLARNVWLLGLVGILLQCAAVPAADNAPAAHPGYKILGCDNGKVTILSAAGKVLWQADCPLTAHDLQLLPGGNILMPISDTTIVELTPEKKVVWKYESRPRAGYEGKIEVHAFQRLADGRTMIAESGNARIIEVDADGKITHEVPLTVDRPDAHRDTRLVRKLENGNYLVCHEGDGKVREYDPTGKVVWSYTLELGDRQPAGGHGPEGYGNALYSAVRLENGNTLIGGGNSHRVLEVDPQGKIVWSIEQNDLPGITLAWVTAVQQLPNGNVIISNCHAGPDQPQLIEVNRDKEVVWQFRDFQNFGNSLAIAWILDVEGVRR